MQDASHAKSEGHELARVFCPPATAGLFGQSPQAESIPAELVEEHVGPDRSVEDCGRDLLTQCFHGDRVTPEGEVHHPANDCDVPVARFSFGERENRVKCLSPGDVRDRFRLVDAEEFLRGGSGLPVPGDDLHHHDDCGCERPRVDPVLRGVIRNQDLEDREGDEEDESSDDDAQNTEQEHDTPCGARTLAIFSRFVNIFGL